MFWVNLPNVGGGGGEDGKDEEDVKDDEDEVYESEDVPVQFPSSSSSLHSPLVTPSSYLASIPTVPFSPPTPLSPSPTLSHHALHDHTPSTYSCVYYPSLPKDSDPKALVLRPHVTDESACYVPLKPAVGWLYVFPGFLPHATAPDITTDSGATAPDFTGGGGRWSVAFNFYVGGESGGYKPAL